MNYEMMWNDLKEKMPSLIDDDGLIILADIEELMEELENEWTRLI